MKKLACKLILCSLITLFITGCTTEEADKSPWTGYARNISSGQLETWFRSFSTYDDCMAYMSYEISKLPNKQWYSSPFGCGYTGNSRLYTMLMNNIYVGKNLYCTVRRIDQNSDKYYSRYSFALKVDKIDLSASGVYCIGLFDALI